MNSHEQLLLESERDFLKRQVNSLPKDALLTRSSTESRLKVVERLLETAIRESTPVKAVLTFRGRPVVGSHGMFADFGAKATQTFTEAVATIGASLLGPLASTGPLPNREQFQFLITNTAVGSFGFEIEEHRPGRLPFEEETPLYDALATTLALLESSAQGTDDELAEYASGVNPRSIEALRGFVDVLASNGAVCTVVVKEQRFRFHDMGEVRRSLSRLSQDNLIETTTSLFGEFQGVLPNLRTFEFRVATDNEVVRGKVGLEIVEPNVINQHLHEPMEISVVETRVGTGKPRYKLLSVPADWE